jgi:hypothetical protein
MKARLDAILRRYVNAAERVLQLMRESHGISDPLAAYWSGVLPQSGRLSTELGGQYRFHGVGCFFTLNDIRIDVDFEPGQSAVGFDAWRLVRFARETLGQDELDTREVEENLARSEAIGELVRRGRFYFLPSARETTHKPTEPTGDRPRE